MGKRSTLAGACLAAVWLVGPAVGWPGPMGPCLHSVGTATAAPSPTCSSDLRECLHAAAKTDIYGVRYVTADDVRRCMETYNSCIHGGASDGGTPSTPPTSTTGRGGSGAVMPQRFTIKGEDFDCVVSGSSVDCAAPPSGNTARRISATLSGSTMTGTRTDHFVGPSVQGCVSTVDYFWPVTVQFKSDGTGYMKAGQGHNEQTLSGTCSGNFTETVDGFEGPVEWSPN